MLLIESLKREHELIERVALSFHTYASKGDGDGDGDDGLTYLRFFELYVGRFHHGREEEVLFPALTKDTEAPVDRGPIPVILRDHERMTELKREIAAQLAIAPAERDTPALLFLVDRLVRALLAHIDAENGVLFPESEARFRRASVAELPDREPDPDERSAADAALHLVARHEPARLHDVIRGGSCTACPFFGSECDGVERTWSSDLEWADMIDRVG